MAVGRALATRKRKQDSWRPPGVLRSKTEAKRRGGSTLGCKAHVFFCLGLNEVNSHLAWLQNSDLFSRRPLFASAISTSAYSAQQPQHLDTDIFSANCSRELTPSSTAL